jgi:hypothetical protein
VIQELSLTLARVDAEVGAGQSDLGLALLDLPPLGLGVIAFLAVGITDMVQHGNFDSMASA